MRENACEFLPVSARPRRSSFSHSPHSSPAGRGGRTGRVLTNEGVPIVERAQTSSLSQRERVRVREKTCEVLPCPQAQGVPTFLPHLIPLPLGEEAGSSRSRGQSSQSSMSKMPVTSRAPSGAHSAGGTEPGISSPATFHHRSAMWGGGGLQAGGLAECSRGQRPRFTRLKMHPPRRGGGTLQPFLSTRRRGQAG